MTLDEFEKAAARTLNPRLTDSERLMDAAAGLAEESGEILGIVRKHTYQSRALDKEKLTIELGDAFWCLAMTARSAGITLERVAATNIEKLRTRYPNGFATDVR
jgi:NTP pyrophosphatase (non-canonical NTP hydrolase)